MPGDPMRLLAHAHDQCFVCFDQRKTTLIFWLQNRDIFAFRSQYYNPSCSEKHEGSWSKYLDTFLSRIYLLEWAKIDNRTTPITASTWWILWVRKTPLCQISKRISLVRWMKTLVSKWNNNRTANCWRPAKWRDYFWSGHWWWRQNRHWMRHGRCSSSRFPFGDKEEGRSQGSRCRKKTKTGLDSVRKNGKLANE